MHSLDSYLYSRLLPDLIVVDEDLRLMEAKGNALKRLNVSTPNKEALIKRIKPDQLHSVNTFLKNCQYGSDNKLRIKWNDNTSSDVLVDCVPEDLNQNISSKKLYLIVWQNKAEHNHSLAEVFKDPNYNSSFASAEIPFGKIFILRYFPKEDRLEADQSILNLMGLSEKGLMPQWQKHIHPQDSAMVLEEMENILSGRMNKVELNYKYVNPSDSRIQVFHSVALVIQKDEHNLAEELLIASTELNEYLDLLDKRKEEFDSLNLAANIAKMGIWHWNAVSDNSTWNQRNQEIFGVSPEKATLNWSKHVHPDDQTEATKALNDHIANPQSDYNDRYKYLCPSKNELKHLHVMGKTIRLKPDGTTAEMIGVTIDETEQKKREQELKSALEREILLTQESQKQLQLIELAANSAELAMWRWDLKNDVISANNQYYEIMGVPSKSPRQVWLSHIHPEDRERVGTAMSDVISKKKPVYSEEYRYRHPRTNELRFIKTIAVLVEAKHENESVYVIGIARDTTEIHEREQVIEESLRFNQKLTEKSNFGVFVHDLNTHQDIYAAPNCEAIHGFTMEEVNEMHKQKMKPLIHPLDYDRVMNIFYELPSKKADYSAEIDGRMITKNGDVIWCYFSFSVFEVDEKGIPTKLLGLFKDVTLKKNMELELIESKRKAEMANVYKNSFISNMSHEIRTPMNGVVACSQLLRDDDLKPEEKDQFIDIIQSSSKQLLHIVDDIIDVARIESGDLNLHPQKFYVSDILDELYQTFNQIKKSEGSQVEFLRNYQEDHQQLELETDPIRLKQIITNFLGNAFKFCKEGKIELGFKLGNEGYEIYVSDQGIGIPKDKQEIIFERFTQVEYTTHSKYGGKGLGLAICKGLSDLLGGRIQVDSEEGEGATFTLIIPVPKEQEVNKEDSPISNGSIKIPNLNGFKILYVDDEVNLRFYLRKVLEPTKAILFEATNGEEAVKLYRKHQPSLILMDIRMPVMDGFKATEAIINLDKNAKVIIQSAHALPDERDKALEIGCVDYLTKPLDRDLLYSTTEKILQQN